MKIQMPSSEEESTFIDNLVEQFPESTASDEEKIDGIEHHFKEIIRLLGLDLNDPSIQKTPRRVAKMYVKEIFSGLNSSNFPKMTVVKDTLNENYSPSIVFVKVSFTSFCEHHFVPFIGTAYVAYKPKDKLIGLSKIPRIVRYYAKRPQLQERLTSQVSQSLSNILETEDIAISVKATHFCVLARGVQDHDSEMVTNVLKGEFDSDPNLRKEFFESINRQSN